MRYRFLPHTADIKFQAFGESLKILFENSAYALTEIITEDKIALKKKNRIKVKGKDKEELLHEFLEQFLFLFETKGFILRKFDYIKIENNTLIADAVGDCEEHEIKNHVKAITYNDMFVKQDKYNWVAQVVVDV